MRKAPDSLLSRESLDVLSILGRAVRQARDGQQQSSDIGRRVAFRPIAAIRVRVLPTGSDQAGQCRSSNCPRLFGDCCSAGRRRRRTTRPIAPKPRIIRAQLDGSGTAFMFPTKSIETCVGRVLASATPVPLNVPEAPSHRPVPPRTVNSHAVSLIPGVLVGVDPPSKVPLSASAPKSIMNVPLDIAPPGEMHVLVPNVKLPSEEVPTVLEGLMAVRNDSGAQVASAPMRVLRPVTEPVNGRTSAFAGKPAVSRLAAMMVRTNLRIFLLLSRRAHLTNV